MTLSQLTHLIPTVAGTVLKHPRKVLSVAYGRLDRIWNAASVTLTKCATFSKGKSAPLMQQVMRKLLG